MENISPLSVNTEKYLSAVLDYWKMSLWYLGIQKNISLMSVNTGKYLSAVLEYWKMSLWCLGLQEKFSLLSVNTGKYLAAVLEYWTYPRNINIVYRKLFHHHHLVMTQCKNECRILSHGASKVLIQGSSSLLCYCFLAKKLYAQLQ